jgi:hypothetical protein
MTKGDNEDVKSVDNETHEEAENKSKMYDKKDGQTFKKPFTSLALQGKEQKKRAGQLKSMIRGWYEKNRCSVVEALGYQLHSEYYQTNKMLAGLGMELYMKGREVLLVAEVPCRTGMNIKQI